MWKIGRPDQRPKEGGCHCKSYRQPRWGNHPLDKMMEPRGAWMWTPGFPIEWMFPSAQMTNGTHRLDVEIKSRLWKLFMLPCLPKPRSYLEILIVEGQEMDRSPVHGWPKSKSPLALRVWAGDWCVSGTSTPARQVPAQCSVILLWADPYYLAISQRRDLSPPAPKKENPNFFDIRIRFHQAQPARQVTMS